MNRRKLFSRLGLLVATLFAFGTLSNAMAGPSQAAGPAPQKTVINLSKAPNELGENEVEFGEAAILALQLGNLMQNTQGRTAIFLTLDGTIVADPDVVMNIPGIYNPDYPGDPEAQPGLLQAFLAAGGRVVVCPLCGDRRELTPDTILDGIEWGSPQTISELLGKAEQIISF